MSTLHAAILAGGSGTRFWPRSTRARPKQLSAFGGERTLLQATADRLQGLVPPERTLVVTNEAYVGAVRAQLPELPAANVLGEPVPRDTAAPIALAAAVVAERAGRGAAIAVLPSDHRISPPERFRAALEEAAELALEGRIVTLGIRPTRPATGYGYIRRGAALASRGPFPAHEVEAFEEKPDLATAERHLASGRHAWNAGIFVLGAGTALEAFERHLADTRERIGRIVTARSLPEALAREWPALRKISFDYAVLEKARGIAVLDVDFEWSDVGSWEAAADFFEKDSSGNATDSATLVALDSARCVVAGDGRLVALLGVEDVVVVQSGGATLVCRRDRVEDVKKLVQEIDRRGLDRWL